MMVVKGKTPPKETPPMTDGDSFTGMTFGELGDLHNSTHKATHALHEAWEATRLTHPGLASRYADLAHLTFIESGMVYGAFRSHPDHPGNWRNAPDATQEHAARQVDVTPKPLSELRAFDAHGNEVAAGNDVFSHDGMWGVFAGITRAPAVGKSAKVLIAINGYDREYYAQVWKLTVS